MNNYYAYMPKTKYCKGKIYSVVVKTCVCVCVCVCVSRTRQKSNKTSMFFPMKSLILITFN